MVCCRKWSIIQFELNSNLEVVHIYTGFCGFWMPLYQVKVQLNIIKNGQTKLFLQDSWTQLRIQNFLNFYKCASCTDTQTHRRNMKIGPAGVVLADILQIKSLSPNHHHQLWKTENQMQLLKETVYLNQSEIIYW